MAAVIRYLSADNHPADTVPFNRPESGRHRALTSLFEMTVCFSFQRWTWCRFLSGRQTGTSIKCFYRLLPSLHFCYSSPEIYIFIFVESRIQLSFSIRSNCWSITILQEKPWPILQQTKIHRSWHTAVCAEPVSPHINTDVNNETGNIDGFSKLKTS